MKCAMNENRSVTFIAETGEEMDFLHILRDNLLHRGTGSVSIFVHNHTQDAQCVDCQAAQKYRDCVQSSACFSMSRIAVPRMG